MNYVDMTAAGVLAISFILGYRRGVILQLVSLLGLVTAWMTAYLFYDDLAPYIIALLPLETFVSYTGYEVLLNELRVENMIASAIAFALLLMGVKLILTFAGHVLNLLAKAPGLNMMNRWSGGLLAVLEAALIILIIVQIMTILPNDSIQQLVADSRTAEWSVEWMPKLYSKLKELPSTIEL